MKILSKISWNFVYQKLAKLQKKITENQSAKNKRICRNLQRLLQKTSFIQLLIIKNYVLEKKSIVNLKYQKYRNFLNLKFSIQLWIFVLLPIIPCTFRERGRYLTLKSPALQSGDPLHRSGPFKVKGCALLQSKRSLSASLAFALGRGREQAQPSPPMLPPEGGGSPLTIGRPALPGAQSAEGEGARARRGEGDKKSFGGATCTLGCSRTSAFDRPIKGAQPTPSDHNHRLASESEAERGWRVKPFRKYILILCLPPIGEKSCKVKDMSEKNWARVRVAYMSQQLTWLAPRAIASLEFFEYNGLIIILFPALPKFKIIEKYVKNQKLQIKFAKLYSIQVSASLHPPQKGLL